MELVGDCYAVFHCRAAAQRRVGGPLVDCVASHYRPAKEPVVESAFFQGDQLGLGAGSLQFPEDYRLADWIVG